MKKIIILIAIMCCFGWCKCKITQHEIGLTFKCTPFSFETGVKYTEWTFHRGFDNIVNYIVKETFFNNGYKTVMVFHKNFDYNSKERIIKAESENAIVQSIHRRDQFNTEISFEQEVITKDLTSIYLSFKELYNIE